MGKISYKSENDSRYIKDLPQRPELTKAKDPELRMPPMLYDLNKNTIKDQPDWLELISLGDSVFVCYVDRTLKNKPRYRCSLYQDNKLQPDKRDFTLPMENGLIPVKSVHYDQRLLFQTYDKKLYYQQGKDWACFDVEPYAKQLNFDIFSVYAAKKDIWLIWGSLLTSALVKFNTLTQTSFTYGAADGLPGIINSMVEGDEDNYYLAGDGGIYELRLPGGSATLNIPWITAAGTAHDPTQPIVLKHQQNDLLIPVNILHVLDPEQCYIEYRLVGYDKEIRRRAWTPQLEYSQLPPGRYTLEIKALLPNGDSTPLQTIPIRIKPPFYATWWAYLIYALITGLALRSLYFFRINQLKRRNLALENTVEERTAELRERQLRITQSIEYASLIQRSVLPQDADLASLVRDCFVIWRPRDIVGGDFYWLYQIPQSRNLLFAAIDCTGHGVPGALLSMTVNSLMNSIVKDRGIHQPAEILTLMHRELGELLHQQSERTQQDGLEISMIKLLSDDRKLIFCGAGLNLITAVPNIPEPQLILGNRYGIGGLKWHKELTFTEAQISYTEKTILYLYTDGIVDQPHPDKAKQIRFGHPGLLELIGGMAQKELQEQKKIVEEYLGSMLTYQEQRDDITFVGLKPG